MVHTYILYRGNVGTVRGSIRFDSGGLGEVGTGETTTHKTK